MKCIVCKVNLLGKQTKFCSLKCKNEHFNIIHQDYDAQREKGFKRKLQLIEMLGGCCSRCGYKKNSAALQFHHPDSDTKTFQIDIRQCSNTRFDKLVEEAKKCELLCSNCHTEEHHPQFNIAMEWNG